MMIRDAPSSAARRIGVLAAGALYRHGGRNTRPTAVLTGRDIVQRMSCATCVLRLPPRKRYLPRPYLLVRLERRVWSGHQLAMGHCRMLMGRPTALGRTLRTVHHHVMSCRRTPTACRLETAHRLNTVRYRLMSQRCHPVMAQIPSTVFHRALMIHRGTQCRTTKPLASKPGTKSPIASRKPCYKSGWHHRIITPRLLRDPQLVRAEFRCALATSTVRET
jgi:hypothetical protein